MKKVISRCSILVIILLVLLSMVSMQPALSLAKSDSNSKSVSDNLKKDDDNDYSPNDSVRIVIELKGKSGVMKANEEQKKFAELSLNQKNSMHLQSLSEQKAVKKQLDSQDLSINYLDEFTAVFNGFSAEVLYKDIEKIKALNSVQKVYISEEYERPVTVKTKGKMAEETIESTTANDMVNAPLVWDELGYDGSGMIVAVLDDGIDVEHRDIILSDSTVPALDKEGVEKIVSDQKLPGGFYTDKVPYGYNYADKNDNIKDEGKGATNHGMHVSGIAGANGDLDNGGIKGVAPEVQILGMKVFSNDQQGGTSSDIYVKAIDDAVKLDADAINMSFGSTSKVSSSDDPAQIAVERATENGTMVMKSAGNGYRFGRDEDRVLAANPDISVSSSPQIPKGSTAVANFENSDLDYPAFTVSVGEEENKLVAFRPSSKAPSPDTSIDEKAYEFVFAGLGRLPEDSDDNPDADDFEGIDLEGKVALIKRGEINYKVKAANAEAKGAKAVVVFNNEDNGKYSNMSTDPSIKIPQVFILKDDGEDILEQIKNDQNVKVAFKDDWVHTDNPRAGKLSASSAWGPPRLDLFIPGITGVGSQILSTLNDDTYGVKSGGSMSAPQVAGGSTLLKAKLEDETDFGGLDITMMTKNILMNTATPMENVSETSKEFGIKGVPYTPRRQGAGLMDLYAAVKTPVVVTAKDNGLGGATIGEVDETFTFTLEAVNFSDQDAVYEVDANVQTDLGEDKYHYLEAVGVIDEKGESPISFQSHNGKEIGNDFQLTVPAYETVALDVTVDVSDAVDEYTKQSMDEIFVNGRFLEGFVEFKDPSDINPELSVPYISFYGEWNKPPVLDTFIDDKEASFYGTAGMVSDNGDAYDYLGVDPVNEEYTDHYAISPVNDEFNHIIPALTFLRNARKVEFSITDEDGNELATLKSKSKIKKHYSSSDSYTVFDDAKWDGKVDGKIIKDGLYHYVIKTHIDDDSADWQVKKVPVYVDTKKPELEAELDESVVVWNTKDNGSGVASIEILADGESISGKLDPKRANYKIDENLDNTKKIEVIASDWAGNESLIEVVDDSTTSATHMMEITNQFIKEGEIKQAIAHDINLHLTAVDHYERKEKKEKVVKHMTEFKTLIKVHQKSGLITEVVYDILTKESDLLIKKWDR